MNKITLDVGKPSMEETHGIQVRNSPPISDQMMQPYRTKLSHINSELYSVKAVVKIGLFEKKLTIERACIVR